MSLKKLIPILLTVAMIAACIGFFVYQRRTTLFDVTKDLTIVAEIRSRAVAEWRQGRLDEGFKITSRPMIVTRMLEYLDSPRPEAEAWLRELAEPLHNLEYQLDLMLLDADRALKWSLSDGAYPIEPADLAHIDDAVSSKLPVLSDLQLAGDPPIPVIKTFAPLLDSAGAVHGTAVIVSGVGHTLYPMLSDWPGPSETSETYLFEHKGQDIVILSPLRLAAAPPLSTRLPAENLELTSVKAIQGVEGLLSGLDYRGVPVFGITVKVPGSDWYLMAEVDRSEVATLWNQFTLMFAMTIISLVALLMALFRLQWRERMNIHFAALENAAAAAERMNRVYRMLSETNELIVRASSSEELLSGVAGIAVERGRFRFAWIGKPDESGQVIPIARAGEDYGYIDQVKATINPDDPRGQGPTGIVLRSGKSSINNNFSRPPLHPPGTPPLCRRAWLALRFSRFITVTASMQRSTCMRERRISSASRRWRRYCA